MNLKLENCLISGVFFGTVLAFSPVEAQIVPDRTLPNNSEVSNRDNANTITGGTQAEGNLFHSFEQFSVPTGNTAYFNNALDIQNIISRVTGSSISNIDGLIRANGTANLFLLNPNGIIFSPNAKLDLGGSFIGSTASRIDFADGVRFSATSPEDPPLLTVDVPVGLGFGETQGSILVRGSGHDVTVFNYQPLNRGNSPNTALKVQPGRTLALVGGDVKLEGGILNAENGRIELGSVEWGIVGLQPTSSGWSLNYEQVPAFRDIILSQKSLADVSGMGGGSIQVEGRKVQLGNASLLLNQNQGVLPAGAIGVNAAESFEISGFEPYSFAPYTGLVSGIWSETFGSANGAEISVSTPKLLFQTSGQIFSATSGAAKAENINLSVPQFLHLVGPTNNERGGTSISSFSLGSGSSGNVNLSTGQLKITNGGYILTSNVTPIIPNEVSGGSGNVNIAADDVEVSGTAPNLSSPSAISAATASTGKAGSVVINTGSLTVRDGGRIDSSTGASGSAGNVTIDASERVEITGSSLDLQNPSLVISAASSVSEDLQQLLKLPPIPSGESGNVTLNTKNLMVGENAQLSVRNDGLGNAGNLRISANSITLKDGGSILGSTASGEGGDIFLNSQNLQLRNGSSISATAGLAGGGGNGGNITIDTDTLAAIQGSSITANALTGRGGNILITTQGIFQSSDSRFDASSQFGVDGTVEVRSLGLEPDEALVPYNEVFIPMEEVMKNSCFAQRNKKQARLVVTGNGGLPPSPGDSVMPMPLFSAEELEPQSPPPSSPAPADSEWQEGDPVVEATGIIKTKDGRTLLGMVGSSLPNAEDAICR